MSVIHVYLPCSAEPDVKWKAWSDFFLLLDGSKLFLSFQCAGAGKNTFVIHTK